ncbi:unnamed protein product, partial [Symbiodinium sp. KB8]
MVKNLRVKKKTPAWIVAARNSGSTTLQDAQLLFKIRDATPELGSGKGERDSRGQTAVYFAAARKEGFGYHRLGFDIRDEPAPDPTMSMLS